MYHDLRGCNRSMCVSSYVLVERQTWASLLQASLRLLAALAARLAAGLFITVFAFQGEMSRITVKQIHLRMHVWARL